MTAHESITWAEVIAQVAEVIAPVADVIDQVADLPGTGRRLGVRGRSPGVVSSVVRKRETAFRHDA